MMGTLHTRRWLGRCSDILVELTLMISKLRLTLMISRVGQALHSIKARDFKQIKTTRMRILSLTFKSYGLSKTLCQTPRQPTRRRRKRGLRVIMDSLAINTITTNGVMSWIPLCGTKSCKVRTRRKKILSIEKGNLILLLSQKLLKAIQWCQNQCRRYMWRRVQCNQKNSNMRANFKYSFNRVIVCKVQNRINKEVY